MSLNQVSYAQKRRSSRINKPIPLAVQGVDAFRAPYREEVTTGTISCHGCNYQMKHEVLPGDLVVLDLGQGGNGHSECLTKGRVKSIQKLASTSGHTYDVGVELEIAGNIWGIASPPEDWFPVQTAKLIEAANRGRELQLVTRAELQTVPARSEGSTPIPVLKKSPAVASLSPWFSDLMGGLSTQIQMTVSEIAAVTLASERKRLLDEFRAQLQREAGETMERVMAASKEEVARRTLKMLGEAAEATVRTNHERLVGAIEKDMENARQRMSVQENELSQRADSMATSTIERLQSTLESSRAEATDRFVTRLREQIAPVLEEANTDLQKLAASQTVFKEESEAIYTRAANQLESDTSARLRHAHDELDKHSATIANECNGKLVELSQTFEKTARESMQTMIASATDHADKNLQEKAAEISNYFMGQLEGHIRSYLEFIGESIAEFPKKPPAS